MTYIIYMDEMTADQILTAIRSTTDTTIKLQSRLFESDINKLIETINNLHLNMSITSIILSYRSIGAAEVVAVAQALRENIHITSIDLSGCNNIRDEGAVELARIPHITNINLSSCSISDEGAVALAQVLTENIHITIINLSNNNIGPVGAVALAQALRENIHITSIDLSFNDIGPVGAVALARIPHITNINLSGCNIRDEGAVALAQVLTENIHITIINLMCNHIETEGAVALGASLHGHPSLTSVNLSYNHIETEGAVAVAQGLHRNTHIRSIDLFFTFIGTEGAIALGASLHGHPSLSSVDLSGNDIRAKGEIAVATAVLGNTHITSIFFGTELTYKETDKILIKNKLNKIAKLLWKNSKLITNESSLLNIIEYLTPHDFEKLPLKIQANSNSLSNSEAEESESTEETQKRKKQEEDKDNNQEEASSDAPKKRAHNDINNEEEKNSKQIFKENKEEKQSSFLKTADAENFEAALQLAKEVGSNNYNIEFLSNIVERLIAESHRFSKKTEGIFVAGLSITPEQVIETLNSNKTYTSQEFKSTNLFDQDFFPEVNTPKFNGELASFLFNEYKLDQ